MYVNFKYILARKIELDIEAQLSTDGTDIVLEELIASHQGIDIEIDDIYIGDEKCELLSILIDLAMTEAA